MTSTATIRTAPLDDRTEPPRTPDAATGGLVFHPPGRWISGWDAEDRQQWDAAGAAIARRNLRWSIFAEFLGFVVWQLWSIVVVVLPHAGFHFTVTQTFWLISIPQSRRRDAALPVHVHGAAVRRPELDDRVGGAAADPPRSGSRSACGSAHAVPGDADHGGAGRPRRRKLRELYGEHHELLSAAPEGWALGLNAAGAGTWAPRSRSSSCRP